MNNTPQRLREQLASDPYYQSCARQSAECSGRITWEHALYYVGRQIQERFAIIPLCEYHHLGEGLVKRINEMIALRRATKSDRLKYPLLPWWKVDKERNGKK